LEDKIDSMEFAKRFPLTNQDLKEGKISPNAVAVSLLEMAEIPLLEDKRDRWKDTCSRRLALLVVPPQCMNSNRTFAATFSMSLFAKICQRETGKRDYEWNQSKSSKHSIMYVSNGTVLLIPSCLSNQVPYFFGKLYSLPNDARGIHQGHISTGGQ
jgi:hypothetical protein